MLKEIETNNQTFVNESKNSAIIEDDSISDIDNVVEASINPIKNGRPPAADKTTKNSRPTDPD